MAVLCFGGSFNPIHHGHLICARAAAETLGIDRVKLIPSAQPPHKPDQSQLAPARHRLAMVKHAIENDPLFEVDDLELTRSGPSYTYDTLLALRSRGLADIHWLIGADMLAIFPQWHRAADLLKLAAFDILARPGWQFDFAALPPTFRSLADRVIDAPLIDLSATDLRRRTADGRSIRYATPDPVITYINAHRLYRP